MADVTVIDMTNVGHYGVSDVIIVIVEIGVITNLIKLISNADTSIEIDLVTDAGLELFGLM